MNCSKVPQQNICETLGAILKTTRYPLTMNWIIKKSNKLRCHTEIKTLLSPIIDDIKEYYWIFSDLDFVTNDVKSLPINFDKDYFILSHRDIELLISKDIQIVWGSLIAIPENVKITIDENDLPYVEGNDDIWLNDKFQIKESKIEIYCWDSSLTIIKIKDKGLSDKFKGYFDEAIELERYK